MSYGESGTFQSSWKKSRSASRWSSCLLTNEKTLRSSEVDPEEPKECSHTDPNECSAQLAASQWCLDGGEALVVIFAIVTDSGKSVSHLESGSSPKKARDSPASFVNG